MHPYNLEMVNKRRKIDYRKLFHKKINQAWMINRI